MRTTAVEARIGGNAQRLAPAFDGDPSVIDQNRAFEQRDADAAAGEPAKVVGPFPGPECEIAGNMWRKPVAAREQDEEHGRQQAAHGDRILAGTVTVNP